jgi:hypothetical protein
MASYKSIIDGGADSDMIYYNATMTTTQNADATVDPLVKFNESRDAPIVRNASQYYFSIIRFSMNGANKNLPLFIPVIQTNSFVYTIQTDPNQTIYSCAIPYQRIWYYTNSAGGVAQKTFTITTESIPLIYRSETQNLQVAPVPYVDTIVGLSKQDLSTRYYWVYTYKHWVTLVNETFRAAMFRTWQEFKNTWETDPDIDQVESEFPYQQFSDFLLAHDVPFMKYNEDTKCFEIYGDTRAFNVTTQPSAGNNLNMLQASIPEFVVPTPPVAPTAAVANSQAVLRLFFNSNMYGLFTNFNNTYWGATAGTKIAFPFSANPVNIGINGFGLPPCDYTNEILFTNQNYTNILNNNPTLQGVPTPPPPVYNPFFLLPVQKQNLYWIIKQDYNSTNSLWSPIQSIVFTSALIPVKSEYTAKPIKLGENNVTGSSSSASAFEPLICDFVVDQQQEKAEGWRDFTLYEPTAEYKLSSFQASHDEIRNIDVQVFWKYRLTGELIPLSMFNCSDVSIKMMFRKIDYRS